MVQAVGFLLLGGTTGISVAGIALTTAAGGLTLAGSLVNLGAGLLLSSLTRRTAPEARPQNVQINSTADAGPRICHVGRVMVGGQVVFHRARSGTAARVICAGHGRIDGVEAYFLDDIEVEAIVDGWVLDDRYVWRGYPRVRISTRLGLVPETAHSIITDFLPEWTEDHRLDGQWSAAIFCAQTSPDDFNRVYPNGEPRLQMVARTARFLDPRTDTVAFTENAALIIAGYCASPDGLNRPDLLDPENVAEEADICDQAQTLAAGGTEARWRLSGSYTLIEPPQDVLTRMLAACAGRMKLRPSGRVGLRVGAWRAPEMVITFDHIRSMEVEFGPDRLDRFNVLPARYIDHGERFSEVDAAEWRDEARIAADGEDLVGEALDVLMSPSHRQTRSLQKIAMMRANAAQVVRLECQPGALAAVFEDEVELDAPELGLVGMFEVISYAIRMAEGGILDGVSLELRSVDPAAFTLSVSEEGSAGAAPPPPTFDGVPTPTGVVAVGQGVRAAVNTWTAGVAIAWDAAPNIALRPEVRFRRSGTSNWLSFDTTEDTTSVIISPLVDGLTYDVSVAWRSYSQVSNAVVIANVVALAVTGVPSVPTGLAVADQGGGVARVTVTASSSASGYRTEILRGATVVASLVTLPGQAVTYDDACGSGTFTWTARAINVSGTPSDPTAGVTQTIA